MARDISLLHPDLQPLAQELIKQAAAAGINIIITQTLRSKAEQDAIYAQGRSAESKARGEKMVSNAPYPQSLHNWGIAFDVAAVINGKANWDAAWYRKVGPIGESLGLTWGGRWQSFPDLPHFELPGYSWSALVKQYGSPAAFIETWNRKEAEEDMVVRYKKLSDIPNNYGFRDVVEILMNAKIIVGDGSDKTGNDDVIDLSHDQVRSLVFEYRGGAFDRALMAAGLPPAVNI